MEQATIPTPNRRRLNAQGRALRRKRIFARLREGWAYDEIAREERLTTERVREIVNEVLLRRRADVSPSHALLQLARLAAPLKVASEAVAGGDIKSVAPLLMSLKGSCFFRRASACKALISPVSRSGIAIFCNFLQLSEVSKTGEMQLSASFCSKLQAWRPLACANGGGQFRPLPSGRGRGVGGKSLGSAWVLKVA
jgi:hypothetical protein